MLAAATTTAYFFAPVGGWKSDLIINPNDLPAPTIHKANAVYGRYNWMEINESLSEKERQFDAYHFVGMKAYKRSEVMRRPLSTLPGWMSGTAHLISV